MENVHRKRLENVRRKHASKLVKNIRQKHPPKTSVKNLCKKFHQKHSLEKFFECQPKPPSQTFDRNVWQKTSCGNGPQKRPSKTFAKNVLALRGKSTTLLYSTVHEADCSLEKSQMWGGCDTLCPPWNPSFHLKDYSRWQIQIKYCTLETNLQVSNILKSLLNW